MSGPCCVWEICCPPPEAAKAVAEELHGLALRNIPFEEAAALLLAKHRLIPRGLNDDPVFRETLNREIRTYLKNQGIPTEKGA
jgi:hypothetical protein